MPHVSRIWPTLLLAGLCTSLPGCGSGGNAPATTAGATPSGKDAANRDSGTEPGAPRQRQFKPVDLAANDTEPGESRPAPSAEAQLNTIVEALQPLQIMLGKWRGTTFKKFNGFSAVDESEWVWDFQTDRDRPALVTKSDKSPYLRSGRLTFRPEDQQYEFTLVSPEGESKVLRGKFEEEPADDPGDDDKPQRTYKLALTQVAPAEGELWQVAFNQQENNRYNIELERKRGSGGFTRLDTIGAQRLGTSFAQGEEEYGEKKCIISGGLGTIQVSHGGKSYWVCCTGCKAAFEEEPERWLAKLAAKEKMLEK